VCCVVRSRALTESNACPASVFGCHDRFRGLWQQLLPPVPSACECRVFEFVPTEAASGVMIWWWWWVAAVVWCTSTVAVDAKYSSSSVHAAVGFSYVDDFCYDESGGVLALSLTRPPASTGQVLAMFQDAGRWWWVYDQRDSINADPTGVTCSAALAAADAVVSLSQPVTTANLPVTGVRPRFWYAALFNCAGGVPTASDDSTAVPSPSLGSLDVDVSLTFTNRAGLFRYHFGKDEQGIFEQAIAFLVYYTFALLAVQWAKRKAKAKKMQYRVLDYTLAAISMSIVSSASQLLHRAVYAHDGVGVLRFTYIAFAFDFLSSLIILGVLLQLAKG
jgi:hypothetical protein